MERFSARQGYRPPPADITIREDAPSDLRGAILMLAETAGMTPSAMRRVICGALLVPPDPNNWTERPNIWNEIVWLINNAPWYRVYDIAEALYAKLAITTPILRETPSAAEFRRRLNDFFLEKGIGWELRDGQITHRGSEAFAKITQEAPRVLGAAGFRRAENEMREALRDISRRPEADITGAIQHAVAALEATAREVAGEPNLTLGKLVPKLNLPAPLDQAVHKLWGYASDRGRHIRENQSIDLTEAELIVGVAGSLCAFLTQRNS